MPFAHMTPDGLVHGTMDLVLDHGDAGLVVVDYKTGSASPPPGTSLDDYLMAHCHERGYDVQVTAYGAATRALNPGRPVRCCVLFVESARLLTLATLDPAS